VWKAISPDMYTTFWCLSLYDIFTPRAEYDAEIALVKSRQDKLNKGEETLTVRKRKLEVERCVVDTCFTFNFAHTY
jgi:THO complex subunit 2